MLFRSSKIVMKTDDAIGREAANVRVTLKDGRVLTSNIKDCRGSAKRPLTDEDISVKTLDQLGVAFSKAQAEKITAECWKLESYSDIAPLARSLGAAA